MADTAHGVRFWHSTIHLPMEEVLPLARHAEGLGFEGVMSPDHLAWWGNGITSKYPFNATGEVWWPEEAHWPDPWVSAAAVAAVTTRVRLGHHVYIMPLRDPVNVAKAVATTAAVAGPRQCHCRPGEPLIQSGDKCFWDQSAVVPVG